MKKIYLQKAKNQIARPNTIRDINKQIVLTYVRERSPISRAEIARETELQRSTVSAIVDELQLSGLIEEIGIGDSTGGRKPTLLKLRTGEPIAIGVDINPRQTTIALADLAGKVLEKEEFPTSPDMNVMTEEIIYRLKKLSKRNKNNGLSVGISIPGIADHMLGKMLYIPYFQWHDWDICRKIYQKLGMSVAIDNDANAIALAELWFGREKIRKNSNFITVLVSYGVGTGIVFDGQVYRGDKGAAGEFGHMFVGVDAPVKCSCGSRECWEAHASEYALISRFQSYHSKNNGISNENVGIAEIVKLAQQGNEHALKSLNETAKYLGIGISNLIVGLSPQTVIVSGAIAKAWNLIKDELIINSERSVSRDLARPPIIVSTLGDNPTLMGALSLVLAQKFASAAQT